MALNNEDLLAISNLLDIKLKAELDPIKNKIDNLKDNMTYIKVNLLENNIIPRLDTIESCYTSTYNRYKNYTEKFEASFMDTEILKKVVSEHSETLKRIS